MEYPMNNVTLRIGGRGTGKTNSLKEDIVLPSPFKKKIILDTFDSPAWRTMKSVHHPENENIPIPIMDISKIKYWKSGIYRTFSKRPRELFEDINKDLWNALFIIEDATRFIPMRECPSDIMDIIWDSKQKNINMVICFHSLKAVPANIITACDYICLGKTREAEIPSKLKFVEGLQDVFHWINHENKDRFATFTFNVES